MLAVLAQRKGAKSKLGVSLGALIVLFLPFTTFAYTNWIDSGLNVYTTGFVGVGANTLDLPLTVSDTLNSATRANARFINTSTSGTAQFRLNLELGSDTGTGLAKGGVLFATPVSFGFADYEARAISFFTGETEGTATRRVFIDTNGFVGFGTDNPQENVHVVGSIRSENLNSCIVGADENGTLVCVGDLNINVSTSTSGAFAPSIGTSTPPTYYSFITGGDILISFFLFMNFAILLSRWAFV